MWAHCPCIACTWGHRPVVLAAVARLCRCQHNVSSPHGHGGMPGNGDPFTTRGGLGSVDRRREQEVSECYRGGVFGLGPRPQTGCETPPIMEAL